MARDLTPDNMKCAIQASCPSVHELETGELLIVGKRGYYRDQPKDAVVLMVAMVHENKIGKDEAAIIISPSLLEKVVEERIEALLEKHLAKTRAWKTDYSHQDDVKDGRIAALEEVLDEIRAARWEASHGGGDVVKKNS